MLGLAIPTLLSTCVTTPLNHGLTRSVCIPPAVGTGTHALLRFLYSYRSLPPLQNTRRPPAHGRSLVDVLCLSPSVKRPRAFITVV